MADQSPPCPPAPWRTASWQLQVLAASVHSAVPSIPRLVDVTAHDWQPYSCPGARQVPCPRRPAGGCWRRARGGLAGAKEVRGV